MNLNCYVCDRRVRPQQSVRIYGEDRQVIYEIAVARRDELERIPEIVDPNTRIYINCYQSILREIRMVEENPMSLRLNVLKQTRNNSCFICNNFHDIHRLSIECKVKVYVLCNIFLPETVRSCNHRLDEEGYILRPLLSGLQHINRPYVIRGPYLQAFLQGMRNACLDNRRFKDIINFTEDEVYTLTSLTVNQFNEFFTYSDRVPGRRINKQDLLKFLCKLRQGLSDEFLATIFEYNSRRDTSLPVATVRQSLMLRFVPENIGLNAITRQEYIRQHVTEFANNLYNPQPNNPEAITYIDGTYVYCHKSTNFRALRQSFSRHKGRHLVKPALMVASDGYILDIHGPYFSDAQNNDAAMLRNELDNDEELVNWFQEGDVFVFDRGYRDIVPVLENNGMITKMPPLLEAGQRQLTNEDANEDRIVTKTRWIVEARNGHLKSKFKYLDNVQQIHVLPNVGDFYRIAGAIINKFHPLIYMGNAAADMAQAMHGRALQQNEIENSVRNENLQDRNVHRWIRLDANQLNDFPVLTIEYLKELTIDVFQIELAPSYIQDKLQREDNDEFQIEMLRDENRLPEAGFLRARIWSRFRNATKYQLWIQYIPNANVDNQPIGGYYCTCRTGARTLGTCVHVTSALWYLGFARLQGNVHCPSHRLINTIDDAGDRPAQINLN